MTILLFRLLSNAWPIVTFSVHFYLCKFCCVPCSIRLNFCKNLNAILLPLWKSIRNTGSSQRPASGSYIWSDGNFLTLFYKSEITFKFSIDCTFNKKYTFPMGIRLESLGHLLSIYIFKFRVIRSCSWTQNMSIILMKMFWPVTICLYLIRMIAFDLHNIYLARVKWSLRNGNKHRNECSFGKRMRKVLSIFAFLDCNLIIILWQHYNLVAFLLVGSKTQSNKHYTYPILCVNYKSIPNSHSLFLSLCVPSSYCMSIVLACCYNHYTLFVIHAFVRQ